MPSGTRIPPYPASDAASHFVAAILIF